MVKPTLTRTLTMSLTQPPAVALLPGDPVWPLGMQDSWVLTFLLYSALLSSAYILPSSQALETERNQVVFKRHDSCYFPEKGYKKAN